MNNYLLIAIIILLLVSIFCICNTDKKSNFNANETGVSLLPQITDASVLIFYAPWCGHCQNSMNEFKEAQNQGNGKIILIDSTDDKNKELVTEYNIKGYPTIIKRDKTIFTGSRKADDIIKFSKS